MHVTYLQELVESRFAVDKRKVLTLNGKLAILNSISISFTNFEKWDHVCTICSACIYVYSAVQYMCKDSRLGCGTCPCKAASPAYQQLVAKVSRIIRELKCYLLASALTTHQALQASFWVFLLARLPNPVAATQLAVARGHNPASLSLRQAFPWQCK